MTSLAQADPIQAKTMHYGNGLEELNRRCCSDLDFMHGIKVFRFLRHCLALSDKTNGAV
jgi:hypothetical protein